MARDNADGEERTRTVLCALDVGWARDQGEARPDSADGPFFLGEVGQAALRAATEEAERRGARLTLLHALPVEPGAPMSPGGVEQALVTRERLTRTVADGLTRAAERLGSRAADEVTIVVEDGPADEAIVRTAERLAAELVVLGDAGAHRPRPRRLGSVAASVARNARCSVLVVREPALAGAG